MPTTLPNMGLVTWTANIDNFNHTQLAQNFTNIDNHNHSTGNGVQVGPGGIANLSINTAQLADGSVTDGKVSATSPITDLKLASANNSVYRTISRVNGTATSANVGTSPFFVGTPLIPSATSTTLPIDMFYLAIADYTVLNKSPRLQVLLVILTNTTVPGVNITAGLNLVTPASAQATSNNIAYTASSQIANSTALIPAPAQNTLSEQASIDFAFPADGFYALTINMGGTPGVGSVTAICAQLRIRHT